MKGYYALWAEYLRFMDENPGAGDDAAREKTGVHWRGTMHARYLGLITEDRAVPPAGREFHQHPDMIDGILARQVMKWYYCVDLFCDPDPGYDVYPVFALLRILLDLPESEYGISLDELRFFVLPTKRLSECQDRVALIRRFRESPSLWQSKLDRIFLHTYVGRIGQILELCNLLQVTDNDVRIAPAHVQEAKWSLTAFLDLENEGLIPHYDNNAMVYLTMLRSTKSVFEFCGDLTNQVGM